jgi:glutathione S-transferase
VSHSFIKEMAMTSEKTLYTINGSCSDAVVALCAHLNLAVDICERRDHDAALTRINPSRTVPTFVSKDGPTLTQTTAILNHLARSYATELLGRSPEIRSKNEDLLSFGSTTMYNAFLLRFRPDRFAGDPAAQDAVREMSTAEIDAVLDALADKINDSEFAVGDNLTTSDFYFLVMLNWADKIDPALLRARPTLLGYFNRLKSMPFHNRAFGAKAA